MLAAVSVGLRFGVEPAQINAALAGYVPTNNRSEMRKTARNTLIVDAYNANPSSMAAALQNFAMMQAPEGMRCANWAIFQSASMPVWSKR